MNDAAPLAAGLHPVGPGDLAMVVTHLEMRAAPALPADPADLRRLDRPDADTYRDLFRRIGAPWLWFGRLAMSKEALTDILHDPRVEVWVLEVDGQAEGLCELDFREADQCTLSYFGLAPEMTGRGLGRAMMAHAIKRAWAAPITRFHVHTCTLDDPAALRFYMRCGFIPTRREVEIAPDPRARGLLAEEHAAWVPRL